MTEARSCPKDDEEDHGNKKHEKYLGHERPVTRQSLVILDQLSVPLVHVMECVIHVCVDALNLLGLHISSKCQSARIPSQ